MGYIKSGDSMILWGRATKEGQIRTSKNGKQFSTFSIQYGVHHDEDGKKVKDYMDVSVWGNLGGMVGDADVGIAKDDIVLAVGTIYRDAHKSESAGKDVYNLNAEAVFDSTSAFQIAQMLINGGSEEVYDDAPQETDEKTPFEQEVEDADTERPY